MDEHWNPHQSTLQLDPAFENYFLSLSHEEALARLEFMTQQGRRFGLILGTEGAGKSSLLNYYSWTARLEPKHHHCRSMIGCTGEEFVRWLAESLFAFDSAEFELHAAWHQIADGLRARQFDSIRHVVLLDDLNRAHHSAFQELERLIASLDPPAAITVVGTAEHDGALRLGRALLDACDLHVELEAWSRDEVNRYLQFVADRHWSGENRFTPQAIDELALRSGGIVRKVVQIGELAVWNAMESEKRHIDEASVEQGEQQLLSTRFSVALGSVP